MRHPQLIVYTTVIGDTDDLCEPECQTEARLVCFTDHPDLTSQAWRVVQVPPAEDPKRTSRLIKALSHRSLHTDWSLWLDACITLLVDPYTLLEHGELVCYRHSFHNRIRDEANCIINEQLADPDVIRQQLADYQAAGFDTDDQPQTETSKSGAFLRRHTPEIIAFNEAWAAELRRYTYRDQMSVDYVAWRLGLKIGRWPGSVRYNDYFRFNPYWPADG